MGELVLGSLLGVFLAWDSCEVVVVRSKHITMKFT